MQKGTILAPIATIEQYREVFNRYHGQQRNTQFRDQFLDWFRETLNTQPKASLQKRILAVLIDARFDQSTTESLAVENAKRVYEAGLMDDDLSAEYVIPEITGTRYCKPAEWRDLFGKALPKLRGLAAHIAKMSQTDANALEQLIIRSKTPYFGHKTARLAVRWMAELIDEIAVDMGTSRVPVDVHVYRVAARLGVIDPEKHQYRGAGSPGDALIQSFARALYPEDPTRIDEPMWMAGKNFCHPKNPQCEGKCILDMVCPRAYLHIDSSEVGKRPPTTVFPAPRFFPTLR